jgi:hypothetical protein
MLSQPEGGMSITSQTNQRPNGPYVLTDQRTATHIQVGVSVPAEVVGPIAGVRFDGPEGRGSVTYAPSPRRAAAKY